MQCTSFHYGNNNNSTVHTSVIRVTVKMANGPLHFVFSGIQHFKERFKQRIV